MSFWKREPKPLPPPRIKSMQGFTLGQVVRHKIDHARVVIVCFNEDDNSGEGPFALCAFSSVADNERECSLWEIEAIPDAPVPGGMP